MKRVTILVVEDDTLVRFNAFDFLTGGGYRVIEAAYADKAIASLENNPDITIVFTNVNIPGSIDGLRLVEAIRKRWPPVMLITTSGNN